jgi:hypothetical protein
MSKYANKWQHIDGNETVSEEHPGHNWYPMVSERRVGGSRYTPYSQHTGSAAWVRAANRTLESMARANFERRGR